MNPKQLASIEGSVLDAGGRPIAEATVMIQESDRTHHDIALVTDDRGRFRFTDLVPGTYTIAAVAQDGTRSTATTTVAAGKVATVQLGP